jgi:hypothetical protein
MATPAIAALNADIFRRFPGTRSMGIQNCRKQTGNANQWSQHAWGNALDIGVPSLTTGDRVAAYLRANAGRLRITNVLWRVADHYDHVHVEGVPLQTGIPPCAGGPTGQNGGFDWAGAAIGSPFGLAGALVGGLAGAKNPLEVAQIGLTALLSGETWLRVMWGVGGFLTLGAGILMLAKEMGLPVPSPGDVAGTIKTVATKGIA